MKLSLKVSPKASRNQIVGWSDNRLKIHVTAPPDRGQANAAIVVLLAETLGIAKNQVHVIAGFSSSQKIVEITGCSEAYVHSKIRQ